MRKQKGYIFKARGWWFLRYFDSVVENGQVVRKQMAHKLTPVEPEHQRMRRPPQSVVEIGEDFLRPINSGTQSPEATRTITDFVEGIYFPYAESQKKASTIRADRDRWETHLKPRCGTMRLRDFQTVDGTRLLGAIARNNDHLARTSLRQFKSLMSAIFKHAIAQGYLKGVPNPMRDAAISGGRESADTYAYSLDEINAMLRVLPQPANIIVAVAAFAGFRRGELQGLRVEDYDGKALHVEYSICEGQVSRPKTKASRAAVPVIPTLAKRLDAYLLGIGKPQSGPMFPSSNDKTKTAVSMNNVKRRLILPALNRCAICRKPLGECDKKPAHEYERDSSLPQWHGYHAFRRGLATNLHDLGVDDHTIKMILRHSSVQVTQNSYIKTLPSQSIEAMQRLDEHISETCNELATNRRSGRVQ